MKQQAEVEQDGRRLPLHDESALTLAPLLTPAGRGIGPFTPMVQSVQRLSATEAAAIKPRRVDVVTVKAGDTVQSLSRRMAYSDYPLERFLTINGLSANATLRPGEKVKIVSW